jgi:hypothetical protein
VKAEKGEAANERNRRRKNKRAENSTTGTVMIMADEQWRNYEEYDYKIVSVYSVEYLVLFIQSV